MLFAVLNTEEKICSSTLRGETWTQISVGKQQESKHVVRQPLNPLVPHTHRWGKLAWWPVPTTRDITCHHTELFGETETSPSVAWLNTTEDSSFLEHKRPRGLVTWTWSTDTFVAMCPITWHLKQIGWPPAVDFGYGLIRWLLIRCCWIKLTQFTQSRG